MQLVNSKQQLLAIASPTGDKKHGRPTLLDLRGFLGKNPIRLSAALSYNAVLSFSPLVLVIVVAAGWIGGRAATAQHLIDNIRELSGEAAAHVAEAVLRAPTRAADGTLALVVAIITLVGGAAGAFVSLQDALNIIWEVKAAPGRSIRSFLRARIVSFGMVLMVGLLLLLSLFLSALVTLMSERFKSYMPVGWLWHEGHWIISVALTALMFAATFKLLPDAKIAWRDVWFGAIVTSILLSIGKFGIGWYLGHSTVASAYGAAGSVIALLIWIYYASLIVLFGVNVTHARVIRAGKTVTPKEHAELCDTRESRR